MALSVGRQNRDRELGVSEWAQSTAEDVTTAAAGTLVSTTRAGVQGFAHYLNGIVGGCATARGFYTRIYDGATVIWNAQWNGTQWIKLFPNGLRITPGNDLKVELKRDDASGATEKTSISIDGFTRSE